MMKTYLPALLFVLLACIGCHSAPFRVEAVEGVVTLDGKPIEGATLTFVPTVADAGKSAYARTNAQGQYKLTAVQGGPSGGGTMPGLYGVAITLNVPTREPTAKELEDQEERGIALNIPMKAIVPPRYNDLKTSGLAAEVVKGKNRFDFELTSK